MSSFVKLCITATISKLPPKEPSVMAITVLDRSEDTEKNIKHGSCPPGVVIYAWREKLRITSMNK